MSHLVAMERDVLRKDVFLWHPRTEVGTQNLWNKVLWMVFKVHLQREDRRTGLCHNLCSSQNHQGWKRPPSSSSAIIITPIHTPKHLLQIFHVAFLPVKDRQKTLGFAGNL